MYRDKHTLVEVTVHRNPKARQSKQDSRRDCSESLSDTETVFRKPRPRSLHEDPVRRDRSRGTTGLNKENTHNKLDRFSEPSECTELKKKIKELQFSLEKSKLETSRYRKEYNVMVKQVEISKGTVTSLESQVADLKRIISKLTNSNGELLEIVSEKINYEDTLGVLENNNKELVRQLTEEKTNSILLRQRLDSVETEVKNLRSLAVDLRSGLTGGSLPATSGGPPALDIGDETRQILGLDLKDGEEEVDSAYDDPRTESIRSRPKSQQLRTTSQVFHQLNVELSENEAEDVGKSVNRKIDSAVDDLSLKFDKIEIPQPRPFEGSTLHLSLSSSDSDQPTLMSTLSEGKFLKGLEQSIDLSVTKLSSQSE